MLASIVTPIAEFIISHEKQVFSVQLNIIDMNGAARERARPAEARNSNNKANEVNICSEHQLMIIITML